MTKEKPENPNIARGARLTQARVAAGYASARQAATRNKWSASSYAQHESGARGMSLVADEYAAAFGVSAGWLLYGESAVAPAPRLDVVQQHTTVNTSEIARAAGTEIVLVDQYPSRGQNADPVPFSRALLSRLDVEPDAVKLLDIDKDNATPDYGVGDTLLIDTNDVDTTRPGAFAVRAGTGHVTVLQLQYMVGTEPPRVHVTVRGANPHAYDVPLNSLPVIGRVRWYGRIV